jgi:hypothetical protein
MLGHLDTARRRGVGIDVSAVYADHDGTHGKDKVKTKNVHDFCGRSTF